MAYWRGGSKGERKQADHALRVCILERTKNKTLAGMIYNGVRAGGSPVYPTWYRWGYGWKYGKGYQPLTDREREWVAARIDGYKKNHPYGYCQKK